MSEKSGDQFSIHVGGNVTGHVIAGHSNRVQLDPEKEKAAEPAPTSVQANSARDQGTVYAVTDGEMHIYHGNPAPTDS